MGDGWFVGGFKEIKLLLYTYKKMELQPIVELTCDLLSFRERPFFVLSCLFNLIIFLFVLCAA